MEYGSKPDINYDWQSKEALYVHVVHMILA